MEKEKLTVLVSRMYEKESNRVQIFIRKVSGADIAGSVFQFDVWKNGTELQQKRLCSGDRYEVRERFFKEMFDLRDDGWSEKGSGTYNGEDPVAARFFDPSNL